MWILDPSYQKSAYATFTWVTSHLGGLCQDWIFWTIFFNPQFLTKNLKVGLFRSKTLISTNSISKNTKFQYFIVARVLNKRWLLSTSQTAPFIKKHRKYDQKCSFLCVSVHTIFENVVNWHQSLMQFQTYERRAPLLFTMTILCRRISAMP